MSTHGTNIGTGNYVDPVILADLGYTHVRLVSRLHTQGDLYLNDYVTALWDENIAVIAVVTPESRGFLCWADAYQLNLDSGVEPDISGIAPDQVVQHWKLYYNTYFAPGCQLEDFPLIGPGLASGDPAYWQEIQAWGGLSGCTICDVHPYLKTTAQAKNLLARYQKITPALSIGVLEWNRPPREVLAFVAMLKQSTVLSAWFCEDCGVEGFSAPPRIFHACA